MENTSRRNNNHTNEEGGKMNMADKGYCVKCKESRDIAKSREVTMKNGRLAIKGECPVCKTGMYKILGKVVRKES